MTSGSLIVLWILTSSEAFLLKGPSGPLVAQLGGSVVLPCSAETQLPLDGLEVQWRRTDSESLVHLFQDGEERPESQDYAYSGRAHFTEKLNDGNYSLVLNNVTKTDSGVYICKVYTNLESNEVSVEIKDIERLEVTGTGAASAYVGEGVTLNCTVDTHIQSKLLEVTWKRTELEILVLLFQNGQTLLNSSHEQYQGRAEFFTSEIPKGNFSLRLKDVRPDDAGEYICEAHSGQLSSKTTITMQGRGVLPVLILAVILCFLALVLTVGLAIPECNNLTQNDMSTTTVLLQKCSRRDMLIRYSLVFCPNVIMSIAFLLCGMTNGFVGEIVTCSTVNLSRFLLLFKTAPYLKHFPERLGKIIGDYGVPLEYFITAGALYSGVFTKISNLGISSVYLGFAFGMPIFYFLFIIGYGEGSDTFLFIDIMNWSLLWLLVIGTTSFELDMFAVTLAVILVVHLLYWLQDQCSNWNWYGYLFWTVFLAMTFPLYSAVFIFYTGQILGEKSECMGLMCGTALLHILTAVLGFEHPNTNGGGGRQGRRGEEGEKEGAYLKKCHISLYMFGAAGLPIVNSIALAADILFKSYKGKRIAADLQVVVLPLECIFASGWLVLQIYDFWIRESDRLKEQLQKVCSCIHKNRETNSQDGLELQPQHQQLLSQLPPGS